MECALPGRSRPNRTLLRCFLGRTISRVPFFLLFAKHLVYIAAVWATAISVGVQIEFQACFASALKINAGLVFYRVFADSLQVPFGCHYNMCLPTIEQSLATG